VVGGTIAGLFQVSEWYHYLFPITGPFLIFLVSSIAIRGTFRIYRSFLEAITMRAKVEQGLGLTRPPSQEDEQTREYWQSERFIPDRYIESRNGYPTSQEFVKGRSELGYHRWTTLLFRCFQGLSVALGIGLFVFALVSY